MPIGKDDANLIEQFIKNAGAYLAYRKAVRQLGLCLPRTDPGSPAEAANLKHLERRHKLEMDARQAAVATGENLTELLARRGEHAILTSLRKWLHFVSGGGGPDNAYPIWTDLKVSLQCMADLIETDPFDALLVAVESAKVWTLDLIRINENTPKGQGWVTHSELDIAQDFYGRVYDKAVALADTHKLTPPPVFSSPAWVAFDKLTAWVKAARAQDTGPATPPKKRRGRKREYDRARDEAIAKAWESFKADGIGTYREGVRELSRRFPEVTSERVLKRILDRVASRSK